MNEFAPMGRISNRYRYPTLDELKCPILILRRFKCTYYSTRFGYCTLPLLPTYLRLFL